MVLLTVTRKSVDRERVRLFDPFFHRELTQPHSLELGTWAKEIKLFVRLPSILPENPFDSKPLTSGFRHALLRWQVLPSWMNQCHSFD